MGLLDNLFGKGKSGDSNSFSSTSPSVPQQRSLVAQPSPQLQPVQTTGFADEMRWVNYAMSLFSQGYGEAEVRSALLSQGLDASDVDRIMTRVMRQAVTSRGAYLPSEYTTPQPSFGEGRSYEEESVFDLTPIGYGEGRNEEEGGEYYDDYDENLSLMEEVSSLVESMVNEKLEVLNERMEELMSRLDNLERGLNTLSSKLEEAVKGLEEKERNLEKEINDMKDRLTKFEPRVKSLEDAFKDIVPNLVDNVREVRELVMEMKHREESRRHRRVKEL